MTEARAQPRVHGTVVAAGSHGILLRGASGAGKSDLALRFLAQPAAAVALAFGAAASGLPLRLVADDQVLVETVGDGLLVRAPATLAGLIELRGIGIVPVAHRPDARLVAVADLVATGMIERMPDAGASTLVNDVRLPLFAIAPFEGSAPIKLLVALAVAVSGLRRA